MASRQNLQDPEQLYFQSPSVRMREYEENEEPFMIQQQSGLPSCCRKAFNVYVRCFEERYRHRHSLAKHKPMFVNYYRICWERWTDMPVAEVMEFHVRVSNMYCPILSNCSMSPSTRLGEILESHRQSQTSCDAEEEQ